MQQQHLALNNCVTNSTNKNLDPSQKELLKWHFRLGNISMAAIQHLLGTGTLAHSDSMKNLHHRASKCDKPKCASCEFGKGKRRPTPGKLEKVDRTNDGALTKEKLLPGQARPSLSTISFVQPKDASTLQLESLLTRRCILEEPSSSIMLRKPSS